MTSIAHQTTIARQTKDEQNMPLENHLYSDDLAGNARLKIELMFEGLRYTPSLGDAVAHSLPNYSPYRFAKSEPNPTGEMTAPIPYMMILGDDTHIRIKGASSSGWFVSGDRSQGYALCNDDGRRQPVDFEALPDWMAGKTSDGTPILQSGVSVHGDMAVVNIAPGCQYFLADKKEAGKSLRCTFCTYGAPDMRAKNLGQELWDVKLPEASYKRAQDALEAAISAGEIRHIYLVGGSLTDWRQEGLRFIELARRVNETVQGRVPITCGSGALPKDCIDTLHSEGLVQNITFNLEVWSKDLFQAVCPGKDRFVGYDNWIASLEYAVELFGRGRVYSAMVAGIELEPEYGFTPETAVDLALRGAEDLCSRGVIPIYSLYWPVGGHEHPDYLSNLKGYFEKLCSGYASIREQHNLSFHPDFMCHRCAYMQVECDIDRGKHSPAETI